jgi:hypothetical protein
MNDFILPSAQEIINLHDSFLSDETWPSEKIFRYKNINYLFELIEFNHYFNSKLWNEEDLARRTNVSDYEIANNKRLIDSFNQLRNDYIERIDTFILDNISQKLSSEARQNSETLGSIIDRLSILSLKIFHMFIQTQRQNTSIMHKKNCTDKLQILKIQREDLGVCFNQLIEDCSQGLKYFKQYKQFKMYNDPDLNPQIYNNQKN